MGVGGGGGVGAGVGKGRQQMGASTRHRKGIWGNAGRVANVW